jgi:xanthine/uracil/vitamin C permease (AzgA family)
MYLRYAIILCSIKLGICVGFALLVSLQALTHLQLVVPGEYTILTLGDNWRSEVIIAMASFFLIGVLLHYQVKGAYVAGLSFGSFLYWGWEGAWPTHFYNINGVTVSLDLSALSDQNIWRCVFDLFLVSSVLLAGLSIGLADLAGIGREDGSPPRRRWLYFSCGLGTIISGTYPLNIGLSSGFLSHLYRV